MIYDRIYYYTGGTELGRWHEVNHYSETTLSTIRKMGYHCVKGKSTIGPPETSPTKEQLVNAIRYSSTLYKN